MNEDQVLVDPHTKAQAVGLQRWFRQRTFDIINRVIVALIVVGGLATALSSSSHRAMVASAVSAFIVALAICLAVIVRYVRLRHRLATNTAAEVARLRRKPGKRLRMFIEGGVTSAPEPSVDTFEKGFNSDALEKFGHEGEGTDR